MVKIVFVCETTSYIYTNLECVDK